MKFTNILIIAALLASTEAIRLRDDPADKDAVPDTKAAGDKEDPDKLEKTVKSAVDEKKKEVEAAQDAAKKTAAAENEADTAAEKAK